MALLLAACGDGLPELATAGPMLGASLERQWPSDGSPARQAAFSRDGGRVATTSTSGRVTVRRAADWSIAAELIHPGGATAVAFSPDGGRLFTAGYDGIIRVWDLAAGRQIGALREARGTVWSIDLSPDGQRIAAAGEDRIIRIWSLGRAHPPLRLVGHELNVWEVRFSPDGRRLASGSFDRTARIWDTTTGRQIRILAGHGEAVVGLDYSPDGRMIATGGDDSTVRLWRAEDGAPLRTMPNGTHAHKVEFSPDGRWLASAGRARGGLGSLWHGLTGAGAEAAPVHLWRLADGALVQALPHEEDVMYVAFSADGRALVTAGEDGVNRLWRIAEVPAR